jgi:hypothetical protein
MFLLVVASEKKFHDRISFYHFIKKGGKKKKGEDKGDNGKRGKQEKGACPLFPLPFSCPLFSSCLDF